MKAHYLRRNGEVWLAGETLHTDATEITHKVTCGNRQPTPTVLQCDRIETQRELDNILFIVEYKFQEHHVSQ